MERKITKRECLKKESLSHYGSYPLSFFEDIINKFKTIGATHIEVCVDRYGEEIEGIDFYAIKNHYETAEEMEIRRQKELKEREEKELTAEKRREEYERNLLKQLKEKYEI